MSVLRYVHILSFGQEGKAFFNNSDSDVTRRETSLLVSRKGRRAPKGGCRSGYVASQRAISTYGPKTPWGYMIK